MQHFKQFYVKQVPLTRSRFAFCWFDLHSILHLPKNTKKKYELYYYLPWWGGGGGRRELLGILASLLRLECKQKTFSNAFQIRIYFLFRSYSFGIETINTFICFRSSLERVNQFQTKMGKVYSRFQTKKVQKPYPLGWHIPIWLL